MRHATSEHTGLLRMGLEVELSRTFWSRAQDGEEAKERRARAAQEAWFPALSEARLRYVMAELEKRFPPRALASLRRWQPDEGRAPLVCHWHLQWSDPLYRDFSSGFLVGAWARPEARVSVADVDQWLGQRGSHSGWSLSTRRRLASGLLSAACEAGFVRGAGRAKELRTVPVDSASLTYLLDWLASPETSDPPGQEIFLSGTVPAR